MAVDQWAVCEKDQELPNTGDDVRVLISSFRSDSLLFSTHSAEDNFLFLQVTECPPDVEALAENLAEL